MKIAFTLCSNNYLAQAKTLGDSLLLYNPGYHFIIGLVDSYHNEIDYAFFSCAEIVPVSEIGISELDSLIRKYTIVEFNTAVKPFFFEYIFIKYSPEHIIYLDPDIAVFAEFDEIDKLLHNYNFLLTPHLLTINAEKEPEKEKLVLNVGIYNLGFLALKNSSDALIMLKWWKERMKQYCYVDFCNGLFVDQIWANYIPAYFTTYHILRSYGYNMGYWNFDERTLSGSGKAYLVNEHFKLVFFHFSNYNPLRPELLCKWLSYSFNERPDLSLIYEDYTTKLIRNKFEALSCSEPLLAFFSGDIDATKKHSLKNRFAIKLKTMVKKSVKISPDSE